MCNDEASPLNNHDHDHDGDDDHNSDDDHDGDDDDGGGDDDNDDEEAVMMKKSPEGRGVWLLLGVCPQQSPPIIILMNIILFKIPISIIKTKWWWNTNRFDNNFDEYYPF